MKRHAFWPELIFFLLFTTACLNNSTLPTAPPPVTATLPPPSENLIVEMVGTLHMQTARSGHTATLLPRGQVLLAGGFAANEAALATTDIFNPLTQTIEPAREMTTSRQSHTATLLPDGRLLLAGGFDGTYLASAELFDPVTGAFTPTGSMTVGRSGHEAILLESGEVLLVGGVGEGWSFLDTAELYNPQTGKFRETGRMTVPRESHTATLLSDGQVLITGGHEGRRSNIIIYSSAEVYDPETGTFTLTGEMHSRRHKHDAIRLADGQVLITGGADERDAKGAYRSAELYDAQTGQFRPTGMMGLTRFKHNGTSLLLLDGRVLLVGGASELEIYNPVDETFHGVDGMDENLRFFATATLLENGAVLFAGGYGNLIHGGNQVWIFDTTSLQEASTH